MKRMNRPRQEEQSIAPLPGRRMHEYTILPIETAYASPVARYVDLGHQALQRLVQPVRSLHQAAHEFKVGIGME